MTETTISRASSSREAVFTLRPEFTPESSSVVTLTTPKDTLSDRYSFAELDPYQESIEAMRELLDDACRELGGWREPAVNLGSDRGLELEWWNEDKCLGVYVDGRKLRYLQSWGPDTENQMQEGELSMGSFAAHWSWLIS